MNTKVFQKIGLNVPSHVITQISIGKTGVIQIFLNNLRSCIALSGANLDKPILLMQEPRALLTVPAIYEDPLWYKYNLRHHLLTNNPQTSRINPYPDDFEYQWQKKQAQRVLKQGKMNNVGEKYATKSYSHPDINKKPTLVQTNGGITVLPPITSQVNSVMNPFVPAPPFHRMGLAAAKIELDNKNEQILEKEDEVLFLKGQLKRMEALVQKKNARIQDLLMQMERLQTQLPKSYNKY